MAEEAPASETSVTMPQPAETVTVVEGTLNLGEREKSGITVDVTSESAAHGGAESVSNAEASGVASGSDARKSLDLADELMEKGNTAMKESDYGEAADNFSRALEIRFHFVPAITFGNTIVYGAASL